MSCRRAFVRLSVDAGPTNEDMGLRATTAGAGLREQGEEGDPRGGTDVLQDHI